MKRAVGLTVVVVVLLLLVMAFAGFGQVTAGSKAPDTGVSAAVHSGPADGQPPAPPFGLTVEDPATGGVLELRWEASADSGVVGYDLYRSTSPDGPFDKITQTPINDTFYTDTGLTNGQEYFYRVVAVDALNNPSAPVEGSGVPTDTTPPATPEGLAVTDPSTSDQLDLRWTPNTESDLAGYFIYRSEAPDSPYEKVAFVPAGSSSYRDGWLALGYTYHYRISAVDTTGNESSPSATVSGAPSAPPAVVAWQHGVKGKAGKKANELFAPRSATRTPNGHFLLVDTFNGRVLEVNRGNHILWEYEGLIEPEDAKMLANGNVLVTDQRGNCVLEIDYKTKAVVWRYGSGERGSGPDQLDGPTAAEELPGGNLLIVDSGNHRIIEVDRQKNIVWRYGTTGVKGDGEGQLNAPTTVQVLKNGNLLVADAGNNRVIEIDRSSKKVVWEYRGLNLPMAAYRLRGGNTLIADTKNERIIEVTRDGRIVWQYDDLYEPRRVEELPGDGNLLVVDQHNHRLVEITH